MDFDSFINANLGKAVETEDPSNLDQCFDWAFAYTDFLNIPRDAIRHLYAYQIYTDATDETRKYFDLIENTPDAIPQKGDLVIFGTDVGIAGHVCIASGNGDTNTFQSTDQNWNGHSYIEYIWHNYNGCLGWLRPKVQAEATIPVKISDFTKMREKCDRYDPIDAAGYTTVDDINKRVDALNKQITDLQTQIVPPSPQTPSTNDPEALQKVSATLLAIHNVIYDKWTFYPGKYFWVSQLHRLKAVFETK